MRFAPINPVFLPFFDIYCYGINCQFLLSFRYRIFLIFIAEFCDISVYEYADSRLRIGRLFTPQDALAHV